MVKLIRLTTDDIECRFHSRFSEDLTIKQNSQIALQSLSMESVSSTILIDGSNDQITYTLDASNVVNEKKIFLEHNLSPYDRNSIQNLFDDMTQKFNATLGRETFELGNQFLVSRNTAGKCEITSNSLSNNTYKTAFKNNIPKRTINGVNDTSVLVQSTSVNASYTKPNTVSGSDVAAGNNNTFITYLNTPISKGSGYFRAKALQQIDTVIATGGDGFIIGVSNKDISSTINSGSDINDSDIAYGVYMPSSLVGGTGVTKQVYQSVINGVFSDVIGAEVSVSNTSGASGLNDRLEIAIHNGRIRGYVWRDSNSAYVTKQVDIFNEPYDGKTNMFPFLIIRGKNNNTQVNWLEITCDPYFTNSIAIEDETGTDEGDILGDPTYPQKPKTIPYLDVFMEFESAVLSNALGYRNQRFPDVGTVKQIGIINVANYDLNLLEISDAFLVQLNNLNLQSYDDYDENYSGKGGKQNLLAVIPHSDHDSQVIYQPNYPLWIDLNNRDPLLLRDIKAIILRKDYTHVQNRGLTSLTILVREPDER